MGEILTESGPQIKTPLAPALLNSTVDSFNDLIRQITIQIKKVPVFPVKETIDKVNRLNELKEFLTVERDKAIFENRT